MGHSNFWCLWFCVILLIVLQSVTSDLNSDRQALLAFVNSVPHGRNLNWTSTSICSSWVGVTCTTSGSRVIALRLPAVGLIGPIPEKTLGKLDALRVLSLRYNLLSGSIPFDVFLINSLQLINLQGNNFSGRLPASLPSSLIILDLSFNSITGEIPPAIQNLTKLTVLNLQNNYFIGPIPDLKQLSLKKLNVSYNNLNGSIPASLQKFPKTSFLGNPLLCGPPLSPCSAVSPSPSSPPAGMQGKSSNNKISNGVIIAIAAGVLALLLLLALCILLCILRKKSREDSDLSKEKGSGGGRGEKPIELYGGGAQDAERNKLVFFEGCSYNFDLEDLLRASAEVLGKGSYGTAYKAVLEDGTTVVVKRLKEVVVGKKEFEQQMEIIGKVGQHPNVVPLRAYYYSKDEKLLVYDYVPSGNFAFLLHANRGSGRPPLVWDSRIKIAIGAARGLAHIHSEGGPRFTHGNIKSSNVLHTEELDACISDIGLASLMNFPVIPRNMVGYRAPEIIETGKFTQKSDVYSFGVLLLELLTGKSAVPSPGNDEIFDLPRWVQSVVREEWTAEVFDAELMSNAYNEEEMVHLLQIAMACVARSPDQRPKMNDALGRIVELRQSDSENRPSSEDRSKDSNVTPPIEETNTTPREER